MSHSLILMAMTSVLDTAVNVHTGRVIFVRGQGKLIFYTLRGAGVEVQIMCNAR